MFWRPTATVALLALIALAPSALASDEPVTRWQVNLSASDSCIAFSSKLALFMAQLRKMY